MAEGKAVTKATATSDKRAGKSGKAKILDELYATAGWHRERYSAPRILKRGLSDVVYLALLADQTD